MGRYSVRVGTWCVVMLVTAMLFVSGCIPMSMTQPQGAAETQAQNTARQILLQADKAWKAGNSLEAERLYRMAGANASLSLTERQFAWERAARAAVNAQRNKSALDVLEQWRKMTPEAISQHAWQEIRAQASGQALPAGTVGIAGGSVPFHAGCVALALPMTGAYSPVGTKVARGALAAQANLGQSGTAMDVQIIDTDLPDWINRIAQLPPQCVAVGGPLQLEQYMTARVQKLNQSRAMFVFMPRLESTDEGRTAWRFFSSPEDQITAMLRFGRDLGLTSYGVLSPTDTYGRGMTDLFVSAARAEGRSVSVTPYEPGNVGNLGSLMGSFVGSRMVGKTPVSNPSFQAVFIPDSWQNLQLVVPYLFYQGEDRLVLMGTTLWEQGLANQTRVNVTNMDLAVFPGAWNKASPSPATTALISTLAASGQGAPDFWVGLGYDFVRFGSALNLTQPGWTADLVNQRILEAQKMDWSMAPISWVGGRAAQRLFVFRPVETGFEPVEPTAFRERLESIRARHARRAEM